MDKITAKTPWEPWMGEVPMHLDYFQGSMFEAVEKIAEQYPENTAFTFMGTPTGYPEMIRRIEQCARALKALGIREGARSAERSQWLNDYADKSWALPDGESEVL